MGAAAYAFLAGQVSLRLDHWLSRISSITVTMSGPTLRARSVNHRLDHSPSISWCCGGSH